MYRNDKDTKALNDMFSSMYDKVQGATPTQFHYVLEAIAKEGRLHRLYTQNIDGLDTQLVSLETQIPLSLKNPWPKTIQLHGDLKTVRCEGDPRHLSRFDPALFALEPSGPRCTECKVSRRGGRVPVLRPRVWLYQDFHYPDADAISTVQHADLQKKPDLVVVVGTALKVDSARFLARDMCKAVRQNGGMAVWINLKAPTQKLDFFDFVVMGSCEIVARHVSTWWMNVPLIFSDSEILELQNRCKSLLIARSPGAAISRALAELDTQTLAQIFQQPENKSKILDIKDDGRILFVSAVGSPIPSSDGSTVDLTVVNKPLLPSSKNQDVLPELLDCWKVDMSKRLSEVVVPCDGSTGNETSRTGSTAITKIANLGYEATYLGQSLWRLKPGHWLNDEIINAYLELLGRSIASPIQKIATSFLMATMKVDRPFKWFAKLVETGTYTLYLPINQKNYHWTFGVVTSKSKEDPLYWTYYDSLGNEAPKNLLEWIEAWFPTKQIKELKAPQNPKQSNNSDCGLFVLMGIRLLIAGRPHLTQDESNTFMPLFRERVLAELLAASLDPSELRHQELEQRESKPNETPHEATENSDSLEVPSANPEDNHHNNRSTLFVSESESSDLTGHRVREQMSLERIASMFAGEDTMLSTLREAVAVERATQKQQQNSTAENQDLAKLWLMIRTEKRALKQRYIHYEFSRQFWAVMEDFNRSPHDRGPVPKSTISEVMDRLEVSNRTTWKLILKRARKASIWTELVDIFKDDLEHPSVVLCAVPKATYKLEALTISHREVFLDTIRSRLKEPKNGILARLKAASSLYWAVIQNSLPTDNLPLECADEELPFEQKVGFG